jgi:hypothetical protein
MWSFAAVLFGAVVSMATAIFVEYLCVDRALT